MTHTSTSVSVDELKNLFRAIGLARVDGELYWNQRHKFLEVRAMAEHLVKISGKISKKRSLTFLDCACGKGYLTFVLNHILTHKLGRAAFLVGADRDPHVIKRCIEAQRLLGYENTEFHSVDIIKFTPVKKPDITFCLHACDTATDETIAKGITLNSRFIVAVPCCQREISRKMKHHPLKPMTQFPIIQERLSCLITETLRTLVLKAAGYKVKIFEFVPHRVTPKNLMLRAEKIWPENVDALEQYWQLRDVFNIQPKIEEYLTWLHPQ